MKRVLWWLIFILSIALVGAIFYNATRDQTGGLFGPTPPPPAPVAKPEVPVPPPEPAVRFPIEEKAPEKPLPALSQSDPAMKEALSSMWNAKTLERFFNLEDFARRVVATIDNLPREKVALRLMPTKPAGKQFIVSGEQESYTIGANNAARYAPYVKLAESVDARQLVNLYRRYYPVFQEAYLELGYPKGYFNDRLVEVIDHLLAAPELKEPVKLVQPKVLYKYEDPDLESRSAGQKIMMRIGPENAARVKAKLREIRAELTRNAPKPGAAPEAGKKEAPDAAG